MSTLSKLSNKKKTIKSKQDAKSAIARASKSQVKAFFDFIRTQGVVGLAVGLVLGGAVSVLVKSLVDNIVMPPIGFLLGSAEGLKGLTLVLGKTATSEPVILHYGIFLNDFFNFIIIALVIYLTLRLLRIEQFNKKKN